jgi:NAD(P)-dependent dehydrogenase (short-subunit alcohol dehydrogenase family)
MLARQGAKVAIAGADIVKSAGNQYGSKNIGGYIAACQLAETLKQRGAEAIAIEADVTDSEQVDRMVRQTVEVFGRLDILVHAAGVILFKSVLETTEEEWDNIINTNLKGTFLVNKAVVPIMQKQAYGRIVNFSSMAGKNTNAGISAYSASKFAVRAFTSCLAKEVARDGITVNAICPGIVATKMWEELSNNLSRLGVGETPEQAYNNYCAMNIPQGVPQTAEDMAEGVLYLLTAPHVTGIALSIDGGVSM